MVEVAASALPEIPVTEAPATEAAVPPDTHSLIPQVELQLQIDKQQKRLNRDKLQGSKLHRDAEAKNALKLTFSQELNKLDNLETRETAVRSIKACLEGNVNREALKLFLSILGFPKTQSAKGRCAELRVIQIILRLFSALLLENSASGLNHVYSLVLAFFSDRSREVQETVAECMCSLYDCSLGLPGSRSAQFILDPLILVLTSGAELNAQQTAAITLRRWICYLPRDQSALIMDVAKKLTALFLKMRPAYPDLISAIGYLLQNFGIEFLVNDLLAVIKKLLAYFGAGLQNGHFGVREACRLLAEIYRKLGAAAGNLGDIKENVLTHLKSAKMHRVAEVQREATTAFLLWSSSKPADLPELAPPRKPVETPASTSRFRTMRDLVKQKKSDTLSSPSPSGDQWGVYKAKFLTRGSGRYIPQLGYGKLDLSLALKSRPSIKDFIKSRGRPMTGTIEIFAKSPTEANRIVPRSGFSESPEHGLPQEDDREENGGEEEVGAEEELGEEQGEHEKVDDEPEEVGEAPLQAFQVEAPIAATEVARLNVFGRAKQGVKKPEVQQPEAVPDPQVEVLQQDSSRTITDSSQKSTGRLKKMVGKAMSMQTLMKVKGKGAKTEVAAQPEDVQPKEKYNSIAVFSAFGKTILQKMESRSVQDSYSPKSTMSETQLSAPVTGRQRLPLQYFSPLVSSRLKASPKTASQVLSQVAPNSTSLVEETQEVPENQEGSEVAEEEAKGSAEEIEGSAEEIEGSAEEVEGPAGEAEETEESLQQAMELVEEVILRETDARVLQFQEVEELFEKLDLQLRRMEAKVTTKRRMIRAENCAPPKYKSHIHPPTVAEKKPRISRCDSVVQTRPPTSESEMQTSSLALYKAPEQPKLQIDSLSRVWLRTMEDLNRKQTQHAYRRILRTGDDIYLLRLMVTTGPAVDCLNTYTAGTLLGRLSQLLCQSFIPAMMLDWIEGSIQSGVFFELGKSDQQTMLETVQTLSEEDTEDGWKARNLYEYLTSE